MDGWMSAGFCILYSFSADLCRFLLVQFIERMLCCAMPFHAIHPAHRIYTYISENSNLLILFIIFIISSDFIWKTLRNSLREFSCSSPSWLLFFGVVPIIFSSLFLGFIGFDFLGIWMRMKIPIQIQLVNRQVLCYLWEILFLSCGRQRTSGLGDRLTVVKVFIFLG